MCLSEFSNEELVILSSTLAIAISKEFSSEDLLILAAFFTTLGDNLALLVIWFYYNSLLPSSALLSVISSVYSRSPPTGIPCAILVTFIPNGFIIFDK